MTNARWSRLGGAIAAAWFTLAAGCGSSPSEAKTGSAFYGGAPTTAARAPVSDMSALASGIRGEQVEEGDNAGGEDAAKAPPAPPPKEAPPALATSTPGAGAPPPVSGAPPTVAVGQDRRSPILIYKADFTMSVYEVQKAIDAVQGLAEKNGGYLARRDDTAITIRVPAGAFQGVVVELSKLGDVLKRDVVSEDVTAEYRDLEVQLQNQLAMRDRFQKLLEKAQKVDEALEIERELGRVTQEIERIKGRLKLLNDLASYSTITVRFSPRVDQQIQGGPFILPLPWLNNLGLPRLLAL